MRYTAPLHEGRLIRRYNRFLADIDVEGESLTVHCPNSGSMAGLLNPGNPVRFSGPHGAHRKLRYTLEQIRVHRPDGRRIWVGVNTSHPNHVVREAIEAGRIPSLRGYTTVRSEVQSSAHSRIDLKLEGHINQGDCWVEVKNCTLTQADPFSKRSLNDGKLATFPDAVTARGAKHLHELMARIDQGEQAALVITVQRSDASGFSPAWAFDPAYCELFFRAIEHGVRVYPVIVRVTKSGLWLQWRELTGEGAASGRTRPPKAPPRPSPLPILDLRRA